MTAPHFRAVRAVIGPARTEPREENVVEPVCDCKIITENGEVWGLTANAFQATKELLLAVWDENPGVFTKL